MLWGGFAWWGVCDYNGDSVDIGVYMQGGGNSYIKASIEAKHC